MPWRLRDKLFFTLEGEGGVLLDLASGRYSRLRYDLAHALAAVLAGTSSTAERETVQPLVEQGIVINAPGPVPATTAIPRSLRDLDMEGARPTLQRLGAALLARRCAERDLHRSPLGALLTLAANRSPRSTLPRRAGEGERVRVLAAASLAADRLLGVGDHCLPASLALWRTLHSTLR